MSLSINCLFLGDEADRIFAVDVDESHNIIHLKAKIKEKNAPRLQDVDSTDLEIYSVNIPFDYPTLTNFVPDAKSRLLPVKKLRTLKQGSLDVESIHVVVQLPPPVNVQTCGLQRVVDDDVLLVNYFVLGDQSTFTVEIPMNRNVSILKKKIKEETAPNLNQRDLKLWQVNLPAVDLSSIQCPTHAPLSDHTMLMSELFQPPLDVKFIHVVVQLPAPVILQTPGLQGVVDHDYLLWVNCFILGDTSTFTVEISMTSNVSILKKMIKEDKYPIFNKISASDLKLWQVNLPAVDLSSIQCPTHAELLDHTTLMSELFRPPLDVKSIHVIVQLPSQHITSGELKARDTLAALDRRLENTCKNIQAALAPSVSSKSSTYPKSQVAYSIHDGRYEKDAPRSSVGPPIELFHPAFGHFLDGIRCTRTRCARTHNDVPKEIIRSATQYMQAASGNYHDELVRRGTLTPILGRVLRFKIPTVENDDGTKPDGIVEAEGRATEDMFLCLLKEDKNEFGDGHSDPSTQAGLSAARSWVQHKYDAFRKGTGCPTFLVANAGPWLAVLGFAFTDCVIVQRLTDFMWVGIDSAKSRSHVNRVARTFYALRTSVDKLKFYYDNHTIDSARPAPTRYFPSITTYPAKDGCVQFKYLGYLENGFDCVTLRAQTYTEPAQDIVVKFVERYSERAHRTLAEAGLAPQLLYHGPLNFDSSQPSYDSLYMVVMEYIDGHTLVSAKSKMDKDMIKAVQLRLKDALKLLHDKDLVFGDLRPPNVMITKESEVKLIDFDWAGEAEQVEYPHMLSSAVPWPKGVQTLDPIKKEHDLEMLAKLFATV